MPIRGELHYVRIDDGSVPAGRLARHDGGGGCGARAPRRQAAPGAAELRDPRGVGSERGADGLHPARDARHRQGEGRGDPPHGQHQHLHGAAGSGPRARDLPLPPRRERLERHRLQRARRPLRQPLRGPRRRVAASGHRRPGRGDQLPDDGHRVDRRQPAGRGRLGRAQGDRQATSPGSSASPASTNANGRATLLSAGGSTQRTPSGVRVRVPRIFSHNFTNFTACAGDALIAQIPKIRRAVQRKLGAVAPTTPGVGRR